MSNKILFLTVLIFLAALFQACASLFTGDDGPDDPNSDSTLSSQSSPQSADFDNPDSNSPDSDNSHEAQVARAIQRRDIVLGMNSEDVVSSWGRPRDVQVAGTGNSGNERWLYYPGNSLLYGINPVKVIYFEDGKVVGWESPH